MPMPMPPPPPTHLMRQDSDEDALSLGQGEDTKPLASVPKAQSTPRRQYITSLVYELDFGKIPGLGPTQAAAAPAQHSATASAAAAEEQPVHYHVPLHPAPAPRKPKPAIVPSFDFSQLPDYAGPAQSISVEPQPMGAGSFQASSSSSADALLSPPPQPQPQPNGGLNPQQQALLQQVMQLTPEQIDALPEAQRAQLLQLRQQVMSGGMRIG